MIKHNLSRRDVLKVIGAVGVSALTSGFLNQNPLVQQKAAGDHKPNFIIILFDALSARHMSLHGYKRKTTPHIEEFARSSIVYHRHYSASNFTQSSTASILTGVYPWSHRSLDFFELLLRQYESENLFASLSPTYKTIAYTHNVNAMDILEQFRSKISLLKPIQDLVLFQSNTLENLFNNDKALGRFAAKRWLENFLSPSYSLFLNPLFTTETALTDAKVNSKYKDLYPLGLSEMYGYVFKMEDAIDWIIQVAGTAQPPFFGYFHLLPPHESYKPRVEFYNLFANDQFRLNVKPKHFFSEGFSQDELQSECQRYDEYIAHTDAEFGRLVQSLKEQGILDNSYLILTSDHGQLFERGFLGHMEPVLYESVIHTPLVIHTPGQSRGVNVYSPTSALDLVPTILQIASSATSPGLEGQVLPALGGNEDPQRIIFSMHARRNAKKSPLTKVTFAALQWPYKLIEYRGYKGLDNYDELFDLENDPEELTNLAAERQSIVRGLKEELRKNQTRAEETSLKPSSL